jgi:hypothetical protein
MKQIVAKLIETEKKLADARGEFQLFALFLREDASDKWDLLVSAPWIEEDKQEAIKYIASNVQQALDVQELLKLSRIVIIDEKNPALEALQKAMRIEHGTAEIQDSNFFGLQIKHAYLITSLSGHESPKNPIQSTA